jgi:TIR domain.
MIKLFFSYSHRDEDLRVELETHLSALKRQNVIEAWHDRRISAGKEFNGEISQHLENSKIILLLISPYFIDSDYCYDIEMTRALELHNKGVARVIPVILRPSDWHSLPFGKLQALPKDGKPISKYPDLHDAFLEITLGIRAVAKEIDVAPEIKSEAPKTNSSRVDIASTSSHIRSSNLRVKRTFTQREKDRFERDAYEYIEKYFENSLAELEARNANIESEFRRIDADQFTTTAYVNGAVVSSCVIRFHGRGGFSGAITFAYGSPSNSGDLNESLSVVDDGYTLGLKPLGLRLDRNSQLTFEGAAEAFWEMFMGNLQR